jgi:hypothetical protein
VQADPPASGHRPRFSSLLADHDELIELPRSVRRVAYSGIRSLAGRTMFSSRHSRMCTTVFLSQLPTATELLVINQVTQQDPQPDPKPENPMRQSHLD